MSKCILFSDWLIESIHFPVPIPLHPCFNLCFFLILYLSIISLVVNFPSSLSLTTAHFISFVYAFFLPTQKHLRLMSFTYFKYCHYGGVLYCLTILG